MNNHKSSFNGIIEAIVYIDNEALKIRNLAKECGYNSAKLNSLLEQKNKLYSLKDKAMKILSIEGVVSTVGYFKQVLENSSTSTKVYKYVSGEYTLCGVKPYVKDTESLAFLGDTSFISPTDMESNLSLDESIEIVSNFISGSSADPVDLSSSLNSVSTLEEDASSSNTEYQVLERKLVECHRLRVDESLSLDGFSSKVAELIDLASGSKKKYPDELELIVSKDKDPENRRKVIYKVKDNFSSLLAVRELGLEKVYVNIVAE